MQRFGMTLLLLLVGIAIGFTIFAQDESNSDIPLEISIGNLSCQMAIVEPETSEAAADSEATEEAGDTSEPVSTEGAEDTPEPASTEEAEDAPEPESTEEAQEELDYPIISLGEDCDDVSRQLHIPDNITLWIALAIPGEEDWQSFEALENDDFPPQLDRRGRFIGCANHEQGEQTCRVLWEWQDITYIIEIPIVVGESFVQSAPDISSDTSTTEQEDSSEIGAEWGACGSCSTCNADSSSCVLSPDGLCVADPGRCAVSNSSGSSSSDGSSSKPPQPATTEEP